MQVEQLIRENFPGERNRAFRLRICEAAGRGAESVMMLAHTVGLTACGVAGLRQIADQVRQTVEA